MTLTRLWKWLWRGPAAVATETRPPDDASRRIDARVRFWAELREGQREAEALKAASLIRPDVRRGE